jgi:hypothetical protein
MQIVRYAVGDNVTNPEAASWFDIYTMWPEILNGGGGVPYYCTAAWLSPARDPSPHWVLNVHTRDGGAHGNFTVMMDTIGPGPGVWDDISTATITNGSAGVHGYHRLKLPWSVSHLDFKDTVTSAALEDPQLFEGALDVAGAYATGSLYVTSGGAAGGAAVLNSSDIPAVRVLGDGTLGAYRNLALPTTWNPQSLGLGFDHQGVVTNYQNTNYRYHSELDWDAGNSRWRIQITNEGIATPANDRTFYAYAIGRRA